jgi:hypothetical protein
MLHLYRKKVEQAKGAAKGALAGNNNRRYSTYSGAKKNNRGSYGA